MNGIIQQTLGGITIAFAAVTLLLSAGCGAVPSNQPPASPASAAATPAATSLPTPTLALPTSTPPPPTPPPTVPPTPTPTPVPTPTPTPTATPVPTNIIPADTDDFLRQAAELHLIEAYISYKEADGHQIQVLDREGALADESISPATVALAGEVVAFQNAMLARAYKMETTGQFLPEIDPADYPLVAEFFRQATEHHRGQNGNPGQPTREATPAQ